jgi:hypothetical protein
MSSFKRLNKADVTTTQYAANKRWVFNYNTIPNDTSIVYYQGTNEPFAKNGSTTTNGEYQSLIFASMNHMFYQSYSDSLLNTGSLMFNVDTYESASQNRPTASYFDYNINPLLIQNFPTASNSTIGVINVNHNIFGTKILPYSFNISSSQVNIIDDGNGNLYGILGVGWDDYILTNYISASYFLTGSNSSSISHVGNIFYAHGIAILTNQSGLYQNILSTSSSISFQNEHIIYENEIRCIIKESEYNLSYNPTLLSGSYTTGSLKDFATGSSFYPYATTIGLYNDDNELLMVAKLGKPIMLSPDTDTTFIVKYDT